MKIGKFFIDYQDGQYWIYSKKSLDKKTGKEFPTDTSYFNTLSGALTEVRHLMIGDKIGKNKEDDLAKVITYITSVDEYFIKCLNSLTKEQKKLADNLAKNRQE